jgi:hypothetical protein
LRPALRLLFAFCSEEDQVLKKGDVSIAFIRPI